MYIRLERKILRSSVLWEYLIQFNYEIDYMFVTFIIYCHVTVNKFVIQHILASTWQYILKTCFAVIFVFIWDQDIWVRFGHFSLKNHYKVWLKMVHLNYRPLVSLIDIFDSNEIDACSHLAIHQSKHEDTYYPSIAYMVNLLKNQFE